MPSTWLITGCTSGLGSAFAHRLLERGDKVLATTRGDTSRLDTLSSAGAKVFSLDVTAPQSDINAVVARMLDEGPIDVLVNNAGYIESAIAEEASRDTYLAQFETNFFGVVKVTNAILPHFRERKAGTIVTLGSVGGIKGEAGAAPYCASKFALEGWSDAVRQETAHLGIKTIIFELGFHRTKMMDPQNIKTFLDAPIAEYEHIRNMLTGFLDGMNGTQVGDPEKAVEVMIDVVKGEGVAQGKEMPERLPLGADALATARKRMVDYLAVCNEWEDVIRSTSFA